MFGTKEKLIPADLKDRLEHVTKRKNIPVHKRLIEEKVNEAYRLIGLKPPRVRWVESVTELVNTKDVAPVSKFRRVLSSYAYAIDTDKNYTPAESGRDQLRDIMPNFNTRMVGFSWISSLQDVANMISHRDWDGNVGATWCMDYDLHLYAMLSSYKDNELDSLARKYLKVSEIMFQAFEDGLGYMQEVGRQLFLCPAPVIIRDDANRLHSEYAAAVQFPNSEYYFLRGEQFTNQQWMRLMKSEADMGDVMSELNADKRAIMIQFISPDKLLEDMGAELIDIGQKGNELYKVANFNGYLDKLMDRRDFVRTSPFESLRASDVFASMPMFSDNTAGLQSAGSISSGTEQARRDFERRREELMQMARNRDSGTGTEYCLRMRDWSTERQFLHWVEPWIGQMGSADMATAEMIRDESGNSIPMDQYLLAEEA